MQIAEMELRLLELVLERPLSTSRGRHQRRPVVLLRLATEEGVVGWGECGALAAPTYTAEYALGAAEVLAGELLPRLCASGPLDDAAPAAEGLARLAAVRGHPMAKAAVEMALLDAWLRASARSLAGLLGTQGQRVPAGATVGAPTTDEVLAQAAEAVAAGYRRVKVKIAPGRDLEPLAALAREFPRLTLSADANGSYELAEAAHERALRALDRLGLAALEQPLPPGDLPGHARLAAALDTPVLLDESVAEPGDLEAAIALRALDGLSVKPGRLGGVLAALRAHDRCREEGLHLAIGGLLETGLARAAHLAVGALAGFDLPGDLGASDRYFSPDLAGPHRLIDGCLAVPDGPGAVDRPDPLVLERATRRLARARAGEPLTWSERS